MARAFTTEASLTAETLFQFFELSGIQIISLRTPQVCAELHTFSRMCGTPDPEKECAGPFRLRPVTDLRR
jgi:hypothetical protein